MTYESNATLDDVAAALRTADDVLITTHAKPDGDALGAVLALGGALEAMGKQVQRWVMGPLLTNLFPLAGRAAIHVQNGSAPTDQPQNEPDRIVVVDTGAWSQLDPMRAWLEQRAQRTIVIDHHLRGDEVGDMRFIDAKAAAACEIVADLIDLLGVEHDAVIRDALFVGIASDTGWFRFSNARPRTHELAARLLREGVDHAALYGQLEQGDRPEKLRLLIRALDSLKLIRDGRAAVMTLRQADFEDTGANSEETERFVDLPQIVRDVQLVVLITEQQEGPTRLSFRSKSIEDAVNVSRLAQQFGGGGHARAAGAKVDAPIDVVEQRVIDAISKLELNGAG